MTTNDLARVPDACTLPTAEQPVRLAEFDDLFATAVRRVESVTATHARLHLSGGPGLEATVRDLTARETECCSFFGFTVSAHAASGDSPQAAVGVSAQPAADAAARSDVDRPSRSAAAGREVLTLDIEVPAEHADVLRALAGRAAAAVAGRD